MSLKAIKEAVIEGDDEAVAELVEDELKNGTEPLEILDRGLVAGMDAVGEEFKNNAMFVPEVLMSANAMQAGNELLKPYMAGVKKESKGKIVIGTVKGDERFSDVKIMIGGAPVNDIFTAKIGANYSHDAASAVELAKKLAEQPA